MQLTIKQAAELLGVQEGLVRRWIRDRGLPSVVFNEQHKLNRIDLLSWAQANQVAVPASALVPHETGKVELHAALGRGGIHRDLADTTHAGILRTILQRLSLPASVDRELLLEMVMAREAQGSTAVGNGIAIPHARYPIVAGMQDPILALGFPAHPIDVGVAGGPITAVFLLLSPSNRTHLHLVARLAKALTSDLLAPVQERAADRVILAAARTVDAAADAALVRNQAP
jgi:PTS system nitrogen regulatory IIA component